MGRPNMTSSGLELIASVGWSCRWDMVLAGGTTAMTTRAFHVATQVGRPLGVDAAELERLLAQLERE